MPRIASVILRSFLQGLILLSPIALTGFLIYKVFISIDSLLPSMPIGIGFVIVLSGITVIGYLGTRFFLGKWVFSAFSYLLTHTPGVKYIYSSIRDVVNSFVGDKKRFNKPVWVRVSQSPETWRVGFRTQDNMESLGMPNKQAVYLPHAYAISGWVIIVDSIDVRNIEKMTAGEAMKFAVSGGITTVEETENSDEKIN